MPRYVDSPPGGAEGWRQVWREDLRYRGSKPSLQRLFEWGGRLFRRGIGPDLDRQRDFNLAALDLLDDVRAAAGQVRSDLRGDVERLDADLRQAMAREIAAVRDLIPIAIRRNDALIEALDQKIETLAVRVRDLTNPLVQRSPAGVPAGEIDPADFIYRRLEDRLRGSEISVQKLLQPYAELARDHAPLIDVGCGRGELLELCRAAGIVARGFDTNERSVADLRARGLNADLAAIPGCFSGIEEGSIGSVAAIHVVEHLALTALTALFRESFRVLAAGGLLMIETPNAESIAMAATDFWRDPSHLAPRHPAALTVLGREHGFALEELRAIHPFPDAKRFVASTDDPESLRNLVDALNDRLYGGQDLRVVFRK